MLSVICAFQRQLLSFVNGRTSTQHGAVKGTTPCVPRDGPRTGAVRAWPEKRAPPWHFAGAVRAVMCESSQGQRDAGSF